MKIAYFISAYKLPDQVVRLVKKLNTADTQFFIHVDKKTKREVFDRIKLPLANLENVIFIKRVKCNWGREGLVKATLEGIRIALKSEMHFDYLFALTGQCYPIKSNQHIFEKVELSDHKSYITMKRVDDCLSNANNVKRSLFCWHIWLGNLELILPSFNSFHNGLINKIWNRLSNNFSWGRSLPYHLLPYYGGSYWCLDRESVEYIGKFLIEHPRYLPFFRFTSGPDEFFFQTILMNSYLADRCINDDLRYKKYLGKANPRILTVTDFSDFMATENLFARKFDHTIDADVLDLIDECTG